jgi:hypothetical protein
VLASGNCYADRIHLAFRSGRIGGDDSLPAGRRAGVPLAHRRDRILATSPNAGLPDTAAKYWLEPFHVAPGLRIVVSGTFPDARYASLQVYDAKTAPFTSNGVSSALADYQITPDQGSVNPWQQQAAPGGHFTVTLREDVAPGQGSTLPLAPLGTTTGQGYLEYRVYLPAGGDFSKVTPPTLTLEPGDPSASLTPCATRTSPSTAPASTPSSGPAATPAAPSPSARARAVGQLEFFKEAFEALTPNVDAAYVAAYLAPPGPGDVVVIRAKAPTYAAGHHPYPWPAASEEVRYWSMCVGLATATLPTVMNPLPGGPAGRYPAINSALSKLRRSIGSGIALMPGGS